MKGARRAPALRAFTHLLLAWVLLSLMMGDDVRTIDRVIMSSSVAVLLCAAAMEVAEWWYRR